MRATEIVQRRRRRAGRANGRGRRLLRAAALLSLLLMLAALFGPLLGAAGGAAALLAFVRDLPDVRALEQLPQRYRASAAITRLYAWGEPDGDGLRPPILIDEIVDPRVGGTGWVELEELPAFVADAHLAAVDAGFLAAGRQSLAAALSGWLREGAMPTPHSPITTRLVSDHLRDGAAAAAGDSRRALQDWFLGWQVERRYSRERQVEWTLNTAYYGHLAMGIEAASRVYFGKGAAELTLGEAAALAAVARDPAANPINDPFDDPTAAENDRDAVLRAMAGAGFITEEAAAAAIATPIALADPPGSDSPYPAFAALARRELEATLGPRRILAGGLQVETTLDLTAQRQLECLTAALSNATPSGGGSPCPALDYLAATGAPVPEQFAIVVLNPASGEIEALLGDGDAPRPLGTLIRPFIYLTALSQGYSASSLTMDVQSIYLQDGRPYSPRNDDGEFLGPMRLREALQSGRAGPATQVLSWVGADRLLATAGALGLRPTSGSFTRDLALATEGFPGALLEVGQAFAAVANGGALNGLALDGEQPRPAAVRRVIDATGEPLYEYSPQTRGALSPDLAYLWSDLLGAAGADCFASDCSGAVISGQSAAGDAWAVGYTTARTVAVRAAAENAPAGAAEAIGQALLAWSSATAPTPSLPRPPGLRAVEICAVSGLLPARGSSCPTLIELYVPGTEPAEVDSMVREMAVNRETGRLATVFTPPQFLTRRSYIVYPPEAEAWAAAAGIERPPAEYDTIRRVPAQVGAAAVLAPRPFDTVSGQYSVTGSAGGEGFAYYRLAYFPGLLPEAMQILVERGETAVEAAELAVWDTTLLDDGLYTLLLTVVREDDAFDEVAIPVTVANGR